MLNCCLLFHLLLALQLVEGSSLILQNNKCQAKYSADLHRPLHIARSKNRLLVFTQWRPNSTPVFFKLLSQSTWWGVLKIPLTSYFNKYVLQNCIFLCLLSPRPYLSYLFGCEREISIKKSKIEVGSVFC